MGIKVGSDNSSTLEVYTGRLLFKTSLSCVDPCLCSLRGTASQNTLQGLQTLVSYQAGYLCSVNSGSSTHQFYLGTFSENEKSPFVHVGPGVEWVISLGSGPRGTV